MITLINPNLVAYKNDILGSGIPYMPITLAYLSAVLKQANYDVKVIDAFGEKPKQITIADDSIIQGLSTREIASLIPKSSVVIIIYCYSVMSHGVIEDIIKEVKNEMPDIPVLLIENTQAVTAYSLQYAFDDFFNIGIDYVLTGEPEEKIVDIINNIGNSGILKNINGLALKIDNSVVYTPADGFIRTLDDLPLPDWSDFPLQNYWLLGYSHGPIQGRFMPILTSRGCSYRCKFCVIPSTNHFRWRARSAENVVNEIEALMDKYNVYEFHLEDVNPTTNEKRILEICNILIARNHKIKWKLVSGTKIETLGMSTLEAMKNAGCNYISFSPETGSDEVLKLMDKPFNRAYALEMTKKMRNIRIFSQACFVLGYPGETRKDILLTKKYVRQLVMAGLDEIAVFIVTPIPGTETFSQITGYTHLSQLTFSPNWRADYLELEKARKMLYRHFLLLKCFFRPCDVIRQCFNFLFRNFETKMEMIPYRWLKLKINMVLAKRVKVS